MYSNEIYEFYHRRWAEGKYKNRESGRVWVSLTWSILKKKPN